MLRVGLARAVAAFAVSLTLAVPAFGQAVTQPAAETAIQSFGLVSGQSGWLLASNRLFWTDSLGTRWAEITPADAASLGGVFFRPDGNGWAVELGGGSLAVAHTGDNGAHWATQPVASPFSDAEASNGRASTFFTDALHGFLMLGVQSGSAFRPGILLRTSDGGASWVRVTTPVGGDLAFTDATHGFTGPGAEGDELYTTADAGATWKQAALTSPATLATTTSTVALPVFSDSTHAALLRTYATDGGPTVVRYETSDGGANWAAVDTAGSTVPALVSLAKDGTTTEQITAASTVAGLPTAAAPGVLHPERSSFSTSSNGWVLFASGGCSEDVCTQTASLRGTLDGGRTYFPLAVIPGVELETASTAAAPAKALPASALHPDSSSVYNMAGVMGFDACSLPTTGQLQDWITNSPYRVVGVYIGGANYANCTGSLAKLNAAWVSTVLGQGWQIIPIWVGPQGVGACSGSCSSISTTTTTDTTQGMTEADSATAALTALGIGQGTPIVYDMEAYTRNTANEAETQAFIEGWVTEMHNKGFIAAVYSSHPEFTDWYPTVVTPAIDTIWFAYFFSTGVACGAECQTVFPTQGSFDISSAYWVNNHRARQTSSGFNSTYGSTTINIDEDWVDAAMATLAPNTLTLAKTTGGSVVSSTITNSNGDASTDTAISCGLTCTSATAMFAPTDTVALVATPSSGLSESWKGCTSVTGTTCIVLLSTSTTVTASFGYPVTVTLAGNGNGTVASSDGNISCGSTCSFAYPTGSTVTLTATAGAGDYFTGWTGCTSVSGASCTLVVGSAAVTVSPTFSTGTMLSIAKTGAGTGTISSSDSHISCGTTCSFTYAPSTTVTLTALATGNSTFNGWSGCTTTSGTTCTVTVGTSAITVSAAFLAPNTLTVSKSGTGTGTVMSSDGSISCGVTCSAGFVVNSTVTLTAAATSGSTFTGWAGCTTTSGTTCTVTMTAAESVTAAFVAPVALTVTKTGVGTGTVTSSDGNINCGATCSFTYAPSTVVTLSAAATGNSTFSAWTGCTTTSGTTCTVTVGSAAINVSVAFLPPNLLTVSKPGTGTGTVTSSDGSISCGATCSAGFVANATVTLTAAATGGSTFSGWTGCTTTSGTTCTVTMAAAESVTATFVAPLALTVTKTGAGTGTVTSSDGNINCGATCSFTYAPSTVVTLTAVATGNSTFSAWTGCTTTNGTTCTVTVGSAAISVSAAFLPPNLLTVSKSGTGTGTVTSSDGSISCGATCSAGFALNSTVTLTAGATSGSTFSGWTGCTSSSGTTCTVTMAAAESVTATFVAPVTLTVTTPTGGSIVSAPAGISCGSTCSAAFASGTVVTLTETPASGYLFGAWSSNCVTATSTTCTITLTAAATVTASFTVAPTPTFSASVTASLSVSPGGTGTDTINLVTANGWTGTFSAFACAGQPATVTCAFSPSSVTATSNATYPVTLTVTVPSTISSLNMHMPGTAGKIETLLAALMLPGVLLPFALRRRKPTARVRRLLMLLAGVVALGATQMLSGCGGGTSSTSTGPTGPIFSGMMTVTYTSTLTGGSATSNTATINLTIPR